ncbi:MAG: HAD family hydrolase [Buchananella hordeovulneris]|nr:HAD family hydrolase [Buchananella hordeovulneris]
MRIRSLGSGNRSGGRSSARRRGKSRDRNQHRLTRATRPAGGGGPRRIAAFFDLDKTIISTSSSFALTRPLLDSGLLTNLTVIKAVMAQLQYALVGANHEQHERMKEQLTSLVRGWDAGQLRTVVEDAYDRYLKPIVYAEALDQIGLHRAAGHDVVIISAGAQAFVEPVAQRLGADYTLATVLTEEDGRYTGEIERYVYGEAKAQAIRDMAAERGYDLSRCYAYSDSITDVPMLAAVGNPFAVNPDRALRNEALERSWRILTFAKPVQLPNRSTISIGVAASLLLIGLSVWWFMGRGKGRPAQLPPEF